jgi:hypothetical protein
MAQAARCLHHLPVARVFVVALAILVLTAGCGASEDEPDRFNNCRYEGNNSVGWSYNCKTVEQCDLSEPCDGSDPNCEPGRTTCFRCGAGHFFICFD